MRFRLFTLLAACVCAMLLSSSSPASAATVRYTFRIGNHTVRPLCEDLVIVAVNNQLPGPMINVTEGDTVIVNAINESPYNVTLHWHGLFQRFTPWADGPAYVTQCPIMPGNSYIYRFHVTGQEGTLWWHAHFSMLRATVYGGLVIRPQGRNRYPFVRPDREIPIILGEWWDENVMDVEEAMIESGGGPAESAAYTINGLAGPLYPCSSGTFRLRVLRNQTYLLRIVNAGVNNQLFFQVAGHNLTVVAIDAAYTDHYTTEVVVLAPGQTTDVLLTANQTPGLYYMAARPYLSASIGEPNNSTTAAIIEYANSPDPNAEPAMPELPAVDDTPTAHRFYTSLTSLSNNRRVYPRVPYRVDERMFITFGVNQNPCSANESCPALNGFRLAASMNNISFQLPTTLSMLEAHYRNTSVGIYTEDFPDAPEVVFDFTNTTVAGGFLTSELGTRVKRLAFRSTVELVLQNTAVLAAENHPIHLHGFNFYVLGQGFGNFNRTRDNQTFNMVNPQERNTIAVPVGGWAVIRFFANNPGVWLMHCHLDVHVPWGLSMAFLVEDGPSPSARLPSPPADLPRC